MEKALGTDFITKDGIKIKTERIEEEQDIEIRDTKNNQGRLTRVLASYAEELEKIKLGEEEEKRE